MSPRYLNVNNRVDQEYIALLSSCSLSQRLSMIFEMSSWGMGMAKRAIARANPEWSNEEVNLYFVKIFYGDSLRNKVASRIKKTL